MLTEAASITVSEFVIAKSVLLGQVQSLSQRFKNLTSDDNCDYEETNVDSDTTPIAEHISLLRDIEEFVSSKKITLLHLYTFYLE